MLIPYRTRVQHKWGGALGTTAPAPMGEAKIGIDCVVYDDDKTLTPERSQTINLTILGPEASVFDPEKCGHDEQACAFADSGECGRYGPRYWDLLLEEHHRSYKTGLPARRISSSPFPGCQLKS
jgi:hypothetical protein